MGTSAPEADAAESSDDHVSLSVPTPRSLRGLSPAATHTGVPRGLQGLGHPPQEGPAQSLGQGPRSPSNIRDTKAAPSTRGPQGTSRQALSHQPHSTARGAGLGGNTLSPYFSSSDREATVRGWCCQRSRKPGRWTDGRGNSRLREAPPSDASADGGKWTATQRPHPHPHAWGQTSSRNWDLRGHIRAPARAPEVG